MPFYLHLNTHRCYGYCAGDTCLLVLCARSTFSNPAPQGDALFKSSEAAVWASRPPRMSLALKLPQVPDVVCPECGAQSPAQRKRPRCHVRLKAYGHRVQAPSSLDPHRCPAGESSLPSPLFSLTYFCRPHFTGHSADRDTSSSRGRAALQ